MKKNGLRTMWRHGLAAALLAVLWPAASAQGGWQRIDDPAPVTGADGRTYTPSCSGYPGTPSTFSFWARKTNSKNLMVYFEGGGACWDSLSCSNPQQFYTPFVAPQTDPALADGVFRTGDPANPVGDWNVLYIPYCTGDIHIGSATRQYVATPNPLGPPSPLPPGTPITIQHRGFDNFMVALDWARRHFGKPKNVLVTGVSAGGYGATANSPWVGRAFPQAHLFVVADSSQGVSTPTWDGGTSGRGSWNPQLAPWVFGPDPGAVPGPELLRRAAQGQPRAKVAQYTPSFDGVQIGFYGVIRAFYPPGGSCPNAAVDWYRQMREQLLDDAATVPNMRYFVAGGTFHTILRGPAFYTEASAGQTFASWLDTMLANRGGTGGQGGRWVSRACPTCLVELPCP